jgi:hypothetical protein
MAASSVTGRGNGSVVTPNSAELASFVNSPAPYLIFTGIVEAEGSLTSPPGYNNTVTFPYPLPGDVNDYVVILTTLNAGHAFVAYRYIDSEGKFSAFLLTAESDGQVMYMVASVGERPQ